MGTYKEKEYDRIKRTAHQLGEHFDNVLILVNNAGKGDEAGSTFHWDYCVGNNFAAIGHYMIWMERERAKVHAYIKREEEKDD